MEIENTHPNLDFIHAGGYYWVPVESNQSWTPAWQKLVFDELEKRDIHVDSVILSVVDDDGQLVTLEMWRDADADEKQVSQ